MWWSCSSCAGIMFIIYSAISLCNNWIVLCYVDFACTCHTDETYYVCWLLDFCPTDCAYRAWKRRSQPRLHQTFKGNWWRRKILRRGLSLKPPTVGDDWWPAATAFVESWMINIHEIIFELMDIARMNELGRPCKYFRQGLEDAICFEEAPGRMSKGLFHYVWPLRTTSLQ